MEPNTITFSEIIEILKWRKWSLILPTVTIFISALLLALLLPKVYRSNATILIEVQEIPKEYVAANITSYADQRLQTISQRIMGTPKLTEIINRFKLYEDKKKNWTVDEIVERMRKKDIKFETISGDVTDPRSGRSGRATIAFSVSFQGEKPEVVQQVTNMLSSLYMEENLKVREQQSVGTSTFLSEELKTLKAGLSAIEARIVAFKQSNMNSLPELSQANTQAYDQTDRDLRQLSDQLRALKEKEEYLRTQLAGIPPEQVSETLRQLKVQLAELKSKFSDEYPDVLKLTSQISELEQQLNPANRDTSGVKPDNPVYVTLSAQLVGARLEIDAVKRQIANLTKRRDSYQERIISSPRVEEGYKNLLQERNAIQMKYDDLSRKAIDVNVAHSMEKGQLGERFTLIDPARLPEKPTSPNVPAIILIGLVLGIGSGVGLTAIREVSDQSVRTPEELSRATGLTVLAGIPEITVTHESAQVQLRRKVIIIGILLALVIAVICFHFFIMDLDVFWARLSRRMGNR